MAYLLLVLFPGLIHRHIQAQILGYQLIGTKDQVERIYPTQDYFQLIFE